MAHTRPHKRQKTHHAAQSVMLVTTIALMRQYSQEEPARPTKRRRLSAPVPYAPCLEETLAAEAMLLLASGVAA